MPDQVGGPDQGFHLLDLMRDRGNDDADELRKEWGAIEVRFLGRVTWMLLGAAMIVGWTVPEGALRGAFVVVLAVAVGALNVPALRVVRRAAREGAPRQLTNALWLPLVLRGLATAAVAGLLL